jgi:putative transposase
MKKNYKYRIFPTKKQEKLLLDTLEECRLTYNKVLETRIKTYETEKKTLNKYATNNLIQEWKKERESLNNVHSQVLQNVAERVDFAFQGFFRRCKLKGEKAGFPRFKQYGRYDSFTFPQSGFSINEEGIKPLLRLSKIGCVKIKLHRDLEGNMKRLTIQRSGSGKWYATFSLELPDKKLTNTNPAVGIDLGLKDFAILSNGEKIKRERFFKKEEKALAKAYRKLSKTEKKSQARNKQRKVLCKISERISNKRSNFTHQLSSKLAKQYGVICLEKLDIKGMQEKETIKVNGQEMKATRVHRSISDVAWNQFCQQLEYKVEETGSQVIYVNPKNTTKMCSVCGKLTSKELSDRTHECSWCGLVMDRDLNASKNILRIGLESRKASSDILETRIGIDSLRDVKVPIETTMPLG